MLKPAVVDQLCFRSDAEARVLPWLQRWATYVEVAQWRRPDAVATAGEFGFTGDAPWKRLGISPEAGCRLHLLHIPVRRERAHAG